MNQISSYPQVFQFNHRAVLEVLDGPVAISEKVDGSQFSLGVIGGELACRSKGQMLIVDAPEKMFTLAIETAKSLADKLHPEWVYRAEVLSKPKHNCIAYARVPRGNLIVYDICTGPEVYLEPTALHEECERLGLEHVPCFHYGVTPTENVLDWLKAFLTKESILGSALIEGIVIKNYARFGPDKKALMAKVVRADFQEVQRAEWRQSNPNQNDILSKLCVMFCSEARWRKAIQHLRDAGKLEGTPRDIALLMREVPDDIRSDSEDEIRDKLFEWAWPRISRESTRGLPEFYKQLLMQDMEDALAKQTAPTVM
jgi:hypothetical protein